MTERDQIVCITADDNLHAPCPSVQVQCTRCGRLLWRSIGSLDRDLDAICIDCVPPDGVPSFTMREVIGWADNSGGDPFAMAEDLRRRGFKETFDG